MAAAFSITAPANELYVDPDHSATAAGFTVANVTGVLVRGHADVVLDGPGDASWFVLEGAADRDFQPGEAAQFVVAIAVPKMSAGGIYRFRIAVRRLDTGVSDAGPEIAVHVPDPPMPVTGWRNGYLATYVGAVAGDLVLLVASLVGFGTLSGFGPALMVLLGGAGGAYIALRFRQHDQAELTVGVLAAIQILLSLLLLISPALLAVAIAVPPLPARGVALWRAGRFAWPWEPARPVSA